MRLGEIHREVGSRYATFRYAGIRIAGCRVYSILYYALLKSREIYEDDNFDKGTRVIEPYISLNANDEDKALLNHIDHFSYIQNLDLLSTSTMTYLVKDVFEKESGEISEQNAWKTKEMGLKSLMKLPFEETDIVKEFVFFDNWFIHDDKKSEISVLEKEINSSLTTAFFSRFFESLNPVTANWLSKGKALLRDLKALAYNTDLLTYHLGLMPVMGHIRDINIYDNDATYVLKLREGEKAIAPEQFIIENYHGNDKTGYLPYRVMSKNYILRRLYHEVNGMSIDKLEYGIMALYPARRLQLDILMYLSESGVKVDMSEFRDIDFPNNGLCSLTHERLERFRKTGRVLSVELSDDNIAAINRCESKRALMKQPPIITEVTTPFKNDWKINKITEKELKFTERKGI